MGDKPVKLGERYRDSISGFEGLATGRFEYLYGCVRIMLEPRGVQADGKRLTTVSSATAGGPRPNPPARH